MEIYRRMGIADRIRRAGLPPHCPMDVFIVLSLVEPPLVHHPYPSVDEARRQIAACWDGTLPLEPYQLISQYTLEPVLKAVAEALPTVTVRYGCALESFVQDETQVTARLRTSDGLHSSSAAFWERQRRLPLPASSWSTRSAAPSRHSDFRRRSSAW